jgi:hypothetical protein
MDAVVTAGGIPLPEEPLYEYTQGHPKAMLDIAGKPMIQWVLDALCEAKHIERIVLIGLTEKSGLKCTKPITYLSNQGHMLANLVAGTHKVQEINPKAEYVAFVSSDIPALTGEMVDWCIDTAMQTREDLYYGVITREIMEARYPNSKRTFTKLKDHEFCGADIHIGHVKLANEHLETWENLINNRKNPFKQAAVFGFGTLFLLLTRQITLDGAVKRISRSINITGRAIVWAYAEAGMDVDKPHQLELIRADLEQRQAAR